MGWAAPHPRGCVVQEALVVCEAGDVLLLSPSRSLWGEPPSIPLQSPRNQSPALPGEPSSIPPLGTAMISRTAHRATTLHKPAASMTCGCLVKLTPGTCSLPRASAPSPFQHLLAAVSNKHL